MRRITRRMFLKRMRESELAEKRIREKLIKDRTMSGFMMLHKDKGGHWFDRDTIEFFNSRIGPLVKGRYFISSERAPHNPRKWSIRKVNWKTAQVDTVGEFGGFNTEVQAKNFLKIKILKTKKKLSELM